MDKQSKTPNKMMPNSLFKSRKSGSSDSNDSKADSNELRKRAALELVKQNCDSMNRSIDTKSKKSIKEAEVFEVPATQVSPKQTRRHTNDFSFGNPIIENKNLKRLQKQDRHSMISSPSMMRPKTEPEQRKPKTDPEQRKPKTADTIFDELKKSEEASQAIMKAAEKSDDRSDLSTSDDGKEQMKTKQLAPAAPVVKTPEETRDCTKVNLESLVALQESTQKLRSVLKELKKTDEKISEFRQALLKKI